eukprot:Gb_07531 [translate_table: standard]
MPPVLKPVPYLFPLDSNFSSSFWCCTELVSKVKDSLPCRICSLAFFQGLFHICNLHGQKAKGRRAP